MFARRPDVLLTGRIGRALNVQRINRHKRYLRRRFDPASLFANGEQGAFYALSDLSTLFQDDAGTTPVTAPGQAVGRVLDLSGNGNHATQATAEARPVYQTDGTLHWLEFDGVDDFLVTPFAGMALSTFAGAFALGYQDNSLHTGYILHSAGSEATASIIGFALLSRTDLTNSPQWILLGGVENKITGNPLDKRVASANWDRTVPEGEYAFNDDVQAASIGSASNSHTLKIGSRVDGVYYDGKIYGGIFARQGKLTAPEWARLRRWFARETGVAL